MNVAIIDYDAGNVQSLKFALDKLGVNSILTKDVELISKSDKVIFPGVGEASSAMYMLKKSGLDTLIPKLTQPVLTHLPGQVLTWPLVIKSFVLIAPLLLQQNQYP